MSTVETVLPRVLAIVLLIVCVSMFGTLVHLAIFGDARPRGAASRLDVSSDLTHFGVMLPR